VDAPHDRLGVAELRQNGEDRQLDTVPAQLTEQAHGGIKVVDHVRDQEMRTSVRLLPAPGQLVSQVAGPLFSCAEAAQGWLDAHPGGRVFPIREAWDLSPYRDYRDRMSALLDLKD